MLRIFEIDIAIYFKT